MRFFAVALLSLVLSGSLHAQDEPGWDVRVFRSINVTQNPAQSGFFEILDETSLPTFGAVPVGFSVIGLVTGDRAVLETGLMTLGAQLSVLGSTILLKEAFQRPRPFETLDDVRVKHLWSATGSSFPSGHTSQAFAIATVFSLQYRKTGVVIPSFAWAFAIGYGRIFLGVHYPSDVLAGAFLGVAGGVLAWSLRAEAARISGRAVSEPQLDKTGIPTNAQIAVIEIPLPVLR